MTVPEKIRVLYVDDEAGNLVSFKSTFRREMHVSVAASGEEALALLEHEEFHVIISDQRMPNMTGSELLGVVRMRHPKMIRMLLTGYADMTAIISAVNDAGINAYLTKPWNADDLGLRIKQGYEVHSLRSEREKLLKGYQQIFDGAGDPILIVERSGRIIDANPACSKLLDIPITELSGLDLASLIEPGADLINSLKKRRNGNEFLNVDLTLRTPGGVVIDCLMTATYMGKQPNGDRVFQAVIKNITDRKKEEARVRKQNAELDKRVAARTAQLMEALEDLGSFSYSVAHDLRSPLKNLTMLAGHLHTSTQAHNNDPDQVACAARIQVGTERLLGLVDDLLKFSQTSDREISCAAVDLCATIEEVISEQVTIERNDQVVVRVKPDTLVHADASMLKVVITNLVSNALKFSRNHVLPEITIGHEVKGDRDVIFVKDNGVGFDPQHRELIFGAFKRVHQNDLFEGTGIGLAIVSRIVGKHGGEVWADSSLGKGTTIYMALPRSRAGSASVPLGKVA
ncbi:MAG: response regulator [Flavobacteriales bacterium]|nr:response regulator [Flavobacteriales bacterium]